MLPQTIPGTAASHYNCAADYTIPATAPTTQAAIKNVNGLITIDSGAKIVANRIVLQASSVAAGKNTYLDNVYAYDFGFKYNIDIVLDSLYHSAGTLNSDGTVWCNTWKNTAAASGTLVTLKAGKGWDGKSKCTW